MRNLAFLLISTAVLMAADIPAEDLMKKIGLGALITLTAISTTLLANSNSCPENYYFDQEKQLQLYLIFIGQRNAQM